MTTPDALSLAVEALHQLDKRMPDLKFYLEGIDVEIAAFDDLGSGEPGWFLTVEPKLRFTRMHDML